MDRKRVLTIAGLGLTALVVVAYLAYMFWSGAAGDRPTLMYFRADL
jgi:hypothetical protein